MVTRSRFETVQASDETCFMTCIGSGDHGTPPHTPREHVFSWPSYTRNYEIHTPNGHYGGRNDWKNFEHFRSVSGSAMSTRLPVYTEKWSYNPHILKGYVTDVRAATTLFSHSGESRPYGSPGALNTGLPRWDLYAPDGHFVPAPANLDRLIADSLRVMMPGIKAELSLLNSVIELKDFRGMATNLKNFGTKLKQLSPQVSSLLNQALRTPGRTLRDLTRKASGGFLNWNFAIEPLISDIRSVNAALSRTERRMNDLVNRAGRRQRRHYTVSWVEYPNSDESHNEPGYICYPYQMLNTGMYDLFRKVFYEPTEFHAEIEFSYYLTRFQIEHAQVLSYLDSLGINPNPAIIWNAVPWSFVVDWVAGVGQWLDSMKTSNMEPMISIHRYLWSVKRSRRIYVSRGITRSYYGLPPEQRAPLPEIRETAYRREVGIPGWNSFYMSGISSKELLLGAALVVSRRKRRNRR